MMTVCEAMQRARINGVRISRYDNEYRVTLNEWHGEEEERCAYYTDDIEDAVLTGAHMRHRQRKATL